MAVLGLIPARGGSKGIPGKNLALVGGKPLLVWSIEAARDSGAIDTIVVSSDDHGILDAAHKHGAVPLRRPRGLALDETGMMPVVVHAVAALKVQETVVDTIVLLQPTSPLRTADDIASCVKLHHKSGRSVVSVMTAKIGPAWMFAMGFDGTLLRYSEAEVATRRQLLPSLVVPNGAVYVIAASAVASDASFFDDALGYAMPAERSIDIDEPFDLEVARLLVTARHNPHQQSVTK